jgi:hypothetical protein
LSYSDASYFSISEKDARVAKTRRERPVPTIEQIQHVITTMPVWAKVLHEHLFHHTRPRADTL